SQAGQRGHAMKLPDVLTLSRLGLAAILIGLLTMHPPFGFTIALVVFLIAGLTDILDGMLARHVYGESDFGRLMDPLTDKVLVCAVFIALVELRVVMAWIVVLIITREFLVTGLRLLAATRGQVIAAGFWGKHKTISQMVTLIVLLAGLSFRRDWELYLPPESVRWFDVSFPYIAFGLSWLVAVITILSGLVYFSQHRHLLVSGEPRKKP
ncbi:MAG: CDP-diacylglycerol--glycerol-3-phosphate 3-phosphatidyltransferase, partial [Kiritimatiellaeota bacterium]|nr:CDP-diacylglycerol--glycerol-3-phosphate 3-phosphatidyltransferase [Kiritimatiellota bacterium]